MHEIMKGSKIVGLVFEFWVFGNSMLDAWLTIFGRLRLRLWKIAEKHPSSCFLPKIVELRYSTLRKGGG